MAAKRGKTQRTVVLDGNQLKSARLRLGLKLSEVADFIAEQTKGSKGGASEITYRRAEQGRPVFVKTARIIAAAFGIPFEELILSSNPDPRLNDVDRFLANVRLIIQTWLKEGRDGKPGEVPAHPEFEYRLTGEWKGWNHFYGVSPDQPDWKENRFYEIFEDSAFRIVESMAELEGLTEPAG